MRVPGFTDQTGMAARDRRSFLYRLHRWAGMVACGGVMMWGLSGVLHPVMSRLQPRPVTFAAPAQIVQLQGARPLSVVLRQNHLDVVDWFRVVSWPAGVFYQVAVPGHAELRYFDAKNGELFAAGDRKYAEFLARHYLGDASSALSSIALVSGFDIDYSRINRLLPVYRVAFIRNDGMRAYVDTATSRLATLVDDRKALLSTVFQTLHTWFFMQGRPWLRLVFMSIFLGAAALTIGLGVWIYCNRAVDPARSNSLRRWHRTLAAGVAFFTASSVFSGVLHLFKEPSRAVAETPLRDTGFRVADFVIAPEQALAVGAGTRDTVHIAPARVDGAVYYRMRQASAQPGRHGHDHDHAAPGVSPAAPPVLVGAVDGQVLENGEQRYLQSLAQTFSRLPADGISTMMDVARFTDEYGFDLKRLPVVRVSYTTGDGSRYYIEADTATLSARINDGDAREGWTFAYLHKLEWLTPLSELLRDGVSIVAALCGVLVAGMGMLLFAKTRRRSPY